MMEFRIGDAVDIHPEAPRWSTGGAVRGIVRGRKRGPSSMSGWSYQVELDGGSRAGDVALLMARDLRKARDPESNPDAFGIYHDRVHKDLPGARAGRSNRSTPDAD